MGTFITPDGQRYDLPGIDDPGTATQAMKSHPILKGNIPEGTRFEVGGPPPPQVQEPPPMAPIEGASPFEAGDLPSGKDVAKAASPFVRPAAEYGGLSLGAAGGSSAGPAGAVVGAGLGYSSGKALADLLDEYAGLKTPSPVGKKFVQSGKDVITGAAMEAGGQILGTAITSAGNAIANSGAAERAYASAIKMPLSAKWVKARGPEGTSNIKRAVGKGLDEFIPPSGFGLEITKKGKADAAAAIDAEISKMTGTYNTQEILTNGLSRAIEKAKKGEAPIKDLEKIVSYMDDLKAGHPPELTPVQLNDLKKSLYELANYDKMYGKSDSLIETMRKGIAHEARLKLQATNPTVKDVNADYASWRLLEEALERSLARRNNRDIIDLGTKVMVGRESLPLAIFNQTVGHPEVKAQIAFMLKKSGKISGAAVGRPAAYTFEELFNQN
jgi:hypothetical protein